jgi:hypothetical protein
MAALGLAFQVLAGVAVALVQLVVTHPVSPVRLVQMAVLVVRHQSQVHQSHALAGVAVAAMNLLV